MHLYGRQAVLLIDTYDSVTAVDRIAKAGLKPGAVRIDSGDLIKESQLVRSRLDLAGLAETSILVSGDLDEDRIRALVVAEAPIDGYGVGNALSTASDAPALGGVYKLVEIERNGEARSTLKLSEGKVTYPGRKQVRRVASESGEYSHDVIGLADEELSGAGYSLLECVMVGGRRLRVAPELVSLQERTQRELICFPASVRDMQLSGRYSVRLSERLQALMTTVAGALHDAER